MKNLDPRCKIIYHNICYDYNCIREKIDEIKKKVIFQINNYDGIVAIALDRNPDYIFTIVALLELGITYLPIDLEQPSDRIKYIMEDSGVQFVITLREYRTFFPSCNLIMLEDDDKAEIQSTSCKVNDLAYVLYTSGSTGNPKGVEVTKKGLENFVEALPQIINFDYKKSIICLTTFVFDIFFVEGILPLFIGMTVVLTDAKERKDPLIITELVRRYHINMIQMTPSAMKQLMRSDKAISCLDNFSDIMIGGERFPLSLLQDLQKKSNAAIYNMYGPTETTIWSSVSNLTYKESIDLGKPILNTEIYILDDYLKSAKDGEIGEICIAGDGLARGYLGRKDITDEKFINMAEVKNNRIYRTGDLGRKNKEGNFEYIGRLDNQIKFYGYRIELEEIEYVLNQLTGVSNSIVFLTEVNDNNKILEALYTGPVSKNRDEFMKYLKGKLPSYMVPSNYYHVNELEYNVNGKIDRKKSVELYRNNKLQCNKSKTIDKYTDYIIEKSIIDIVKLIADVGTDDGITSETKIIDIGIDSIKFVQMIIRIEEKFHIEFEMEKLSIAEMRTIHSVVSYVKSKKGNRTI